MEASLEILYVDIRAYHKKLGFFVGCPHSNEALLSIVISFFSSTSTSKSCHRYLSS